MDIRTHADAERHVADLADHLTRPSDDECLLCYVIRMLSEFGCDTTLRWATRWRDVRVPRATGLERRLESRGGFCDCEVFWNGWTLRADLLVPDQFDRDPAWPEELPTCAGVDRRSSQPCRLWEPWRRPRW